MSHAYGCETWSLTLREECWLSVFESRVPRMIFGPKRDEVTGEWRKRHNECCHDLYFSSDIRVFSMRLVGHVALWGEKRCLQGFMGKPEGKRPLGKLRRRLEDNINMVFQEVGWGLVWLRVGTSGGLLWMRGISWLAEDLLALQEDSASWSWSSRILCLLTRTASALTRINCSPSVDFVQVHLTAELSHIVQFITYSKIELPEDCINGCRKASEWKLACDLICSV